MDQQEQPALDYLKVLEHQVNAVNQICVVVDDWAEKKGWNEPQTDQMAKHISKELARIAIAHATLSDFAEKVRHGTMPSYKDAALINDLINLNLVLATTPCTDDQVEDLAQVALFHTELSECSQAIISKQPDDHCPKLPGWLAEIADTCIRFFHFCGRKKADLGGAIQTKHDYNTRRPYRHGKLK